MAESVDALVSNTSGREAVPVRPRLRVQNKLGSKAKLILYQSAAEAASFSDPSRFRAEMLLSTRNSESQFIRPLGTYNAYSWALRAENGSESRTTRV